jgi:hypothetical protein
VYRLEFDYLNVNEVMRVIKNENLQIKKQVFDNNCSMEIAIRRSKVNQLLDDFKKIAGVSLEFLGTA